MIGREGVIVDDISKHEERHGAGGIVQTDRDLDTGLV